jgi:hypothetical protein
MTFSAINVAMTCSKNNAVARNPSMGIISCNIGWNLGSAVVLLKEGSPRVKYSRISDWPYAKLETLSAKRRGKLGGGYAGGVGISLGTSTNVALSFCPAYQFIKTEAAPNAQAFLLRIVVEFPV